MVMLLNGVEFQGVEFQGSCCARAQVSLCFCFGTWVFRVQVAGLIEVWGFGV